MPWSARDLRTVLARAGFVELRQRGSHLRLRRVAPSGAARYVTLPLHRGDLPAGTVKAIFREAGLSEADARRILRG